MNKRLLLDSHAFLWATASPLDLGPRARKALENPGNEVYVSAASLWELLLKASKGELDLGIHPTGKLRALVDGLHAFVLPVQFDHLEEAYSLPRLHREPFDRLLIGQARAEGMILVTKDRTIGQYEVEILW